MTKGIRGRIFTWLLVAIIPVLTVAFLSISIVESRLADQAVSDLANERRLEVNRIDQELARFASDAHRVARSSYVHMFNDVPQGNDIMQPHLPLNAVARAIEEAAFGAGTSVLRARVVGLDGVTIAQSSGYAVEPESEELVDRLLAGEPVRFGQAKQHGNGNYCIELVTPITDPSGSIVGALVTEADLSPIVELLVAHQSFGETREAYLVQGEPDGSILHLSDLRFESDSGIPR